ncbi:MULTISPECIES: DMT family transporter [unclassified Amycolatopsis]|uniref:EamA family transporter n=1 Tax=unclassified Amycolatopsis TaxID=2618356 RepID=UPI001C6A6F29|nr:EamA family transporter [Amycolatopsis sp. DSM 110486]QYN21038.1 EamA family transporter [Amycolatopsis sp. DSM 110486]
MTTELPVLAPPRVAHRGRGVAFVLLAALFFSTSGTLGKPAMAAGMTPEQVATFRIGFAGLLLLAGTAAIAPRTLKVRRGEWPMLLAYGLLGVAGTQLAYFIAADRVPVGIAILLEFLSPVLIALWVRVVRRTHLPRAMWAGIGLAIAGLALVGQVWQGLTLDAIGVLAGLGAAVCSAGYFLIGERAVADRDPLGLVTWGMVIGAVIVSVVSPPWTIPWSLLDHAVEFGPWTPPIWLLLTLLVLLSTVLSYLLGITALRHLPASVASVLGLLEPVTATAFAWALLGEALAWPQALGAAILLGGAYVVQRFSKGVT